MTEDRMNELVDAIKILTNNLTEANDEQAIAVVLSALMGAILMAGKPLMRYANLAAGFAGQMEKELIALLEPTNKYRH